MLPTINRPFLAGAGTLVRSVRVAERGAHMLWIVFAVVLVLWLIGVSFHLAGALIHLLLVFALIVLVANLVIKRRRTF